MRLEFDQDPVRFIIHLDLPRSLEAYVVKVRLGLPA